MKRNSCSVIGTVLWVLLVCSPVETANGGANQNGTGESAYALDGDDVRLNDYDPVIHWNQVFIDTILATNTANSVSQRLAAIVHVAMFDSYNGIARRWTPIFMEHDGPRNGSRRAATVQAAYRTLSALFPTRQAELDAELTTAMGLHRQWRIGGPRARVGQRGGSRRARVAVGGRLCGFHPVVHGRDRGGAVAADTASVRGDELADDRLHHAVCGVQPVSVPPGHASGLDHRDVHGRLQCGQGARTQDRFDPHARPDRARCLLGVQRDHSLERRGEPDRARQRNLVVVRTSACLRS